MSVLAVAREVQAVDGRSIARMNSRHRNLLGCRRDLHTAARVRRRPVSCSVGEDEPTIGTASGGLTVRAMIEEARTGH